MHEVQHLVALDDRLVQLRTPLNSTAIYPKYDHTLYSVLITKIKSLFILALISIGFCFSLSSFSS
jgi:hypothetical protein